MKVTNISGVTMNVRGKDGVVPIAPGKSRDIEFTDEQLERARNRQYLSLDEPEVLQKPAKAQPKAKGDSTGELPVDQV